MFNLLSKCFLSEPVRGLQELLIHFLLSKLWYYWIFRWLKSGLLVDRYFIPVYHIMYCMSFCFWLKSSGYYKGCWLTKGCWVVRKWLRSSHWTLFVLEVTLTLAKNDGDDTVGSSISLPTWEDLVELHINWCRIAAINSRSGRNPTNQTRWNIDQYNCNVVRQTYNSDIRQLPAWNVKIEDLKWMQLIFGDTWWMVFVGKCIEQPSDSSWNYRIFVLRGAFADVLATHDLGLFPRFQGHVIHAGGGLAGCVGKIPKKMIQEKDHLKDDILKSVLVGSHFTPKINRSNSNMFHIIVGCLIRWLDPYCQNSHGQTGPGRLSTVIARSARIFVGSWVPWVLVVSWDNVYPENQVHIAKVGWIPIYFVHLPNFC